MANVLQSKTCQKRKNFSQSERRKFWLMPKFSAALSGIARPYGHFVFPYKEQNKPHYGDKKSRHAPPEAGAVLLARTGIKIFLIDGCAAIRAVL